MNRRSRIYILLSFVAVLSLGYVRSYGQIEVNGTFDVPVRQFERMFRIVTADQNGLVLFRETTRFEESTEHTWELLLLDTDLEVRWSTSLKTDLSYSLTAACTLDNYLYLLFKNQSSSKKDIKIFKIDLTTKGFVIIPIGTFVPRTIDYFKVVNNTIILGGSEKGKPAVVFYPQLSDRPVILQGIFGKKGKVLDIYHDTKNNICTIPYQYRNTDGNWSVSIKSYDYKGKIIEETNIEPEGLEQFKDARTRILGDRRIVAGTYYKRGNSAMQGYFSTSISPTGSYDLKLFPLNTLNVEDTTSVDTALVNMDSIAEIRIPVKYEHMLVREMQEHNGQVIFLTETMNPQDMNAKNREKSLGKVRFIKGAITSFNRQGDLLWNFDYLMSGYYSEINPALTKMRQKKDTIITFLFYRKSIAEQKLVDGELVSGFKYTDLGLMDFYDEFDKESLGIHSEIRKWYGSYYILISIANDPKTIENITMLSLRKVKVE